ncbi:SIMPL domain-containing protein [Cohnella pontilimi]|nr:SIMPL domain-containing protein [Cohnella pontilimi]
MKQKSWQTAVLVMAVAAVGWFGFGRGEGDLAGAEPLDTAAMAAVSALNTITVGANGSVMVDPDIAYLNVAVETRGSTAAAAQQSNADKFAAVEKTLYEKFAIDKKDVQTTGFFVQPEYNYTEKEGRKLVGYTAVHSVQVKYRKLGEIGKLLDALSAAGANRMDGVQFGTEKSDEYERQALQKAMANAEAKANVLAASAKREVKKVVNIVQGAASTPPILLQSNAKMMADSAASMPASSVQVGQIEVTTSVTVQYEMR